MADDHVDGVDEYWLDDMEILDRGEVDHVVYVLSEGESEGRPFVNYYEVKEIAAAEAGGSPLVTIAILTFSEVTFANNLAAAVHDIEAVGAPSIVALDPDDLGEGERDADADRRDPDAGNEADERGSRDEDADDDRDDNEVDDRDAEDEDAEERRGENGQIDESTYESQAHGYVVGWDEAWVVSPDETTTQEGLDRLTLYAEQGDAMLHFFGVSSGWRSTEIVDVFVGDFQAAHGGALDVTGLGVEDGVVYALLEEGGDGPRSPSRPESWTGSCLPASC